LIPRSAAHTLLAFVLFSVSFPVAARADWLFTPFVGSTFATETSYLVLETGAANKAQLILGGSAALLSRGIFGVEADFSYAPRFFERDNRAGNISGSNVTTLSGSVIAAVPLSVTRESLRPYVVGGIGLLHAAASDAVFNFSFADNFAGLNVGGGAIGLISPRAGYRFELRHFKSLGDTAHVLTGENTARLSFWRATVGVVIRIAN
jgi:hypothetical protein